MRRTHLPSLVYLGLALTLAAVLVGLAGLSVLRKVETFQPLGFESTPAAGARLVGAEPLEVTGLAAGDRILLVNGAPITTAAAMRAQLLERPASQLTVARGSELVEVRYVRPDLDVDYRYLALALAGALYLLIGLFTVFKQPRPQGLLFFFWCLASAAAYLFTTLPPFDAVGKALYAGDGLALLLLAPLTLHLFLTFPSPLALRSLPLRRLVPFLYLPSLVVALLQVDLMFLGGRLVFGPPTARAVRLLDRLELGHLLVFVALALAALGLRFARETGIEERRQVRWMVVGVTGGFLPFLLLYGVPRLLALEAPELLTTLGVVPLGLVPLTFAYAILRYKLWDIDVIVRDAISTTLTLMLGVLGFALLNLFISRGLPQEMAQARTALSFVAGLVIAGLLVPARRGIGASLERVHYRSNFGRRRALAELGRELLHERDLDQLCAGLLEHLEVALELDRVNLYLVQRGSLVAVRPQPGAPAQIPLNVLGRGAWEGEVAALSGLEPPAAEPRPATRLFLAGYRYAFPLTVRGSRVGLAVTGYRYEQRPLSSEDVELVRQLLNQAALAIENAQLLDRLHHQLEEVMRLQRYSEGIIESSPAGLAVLGEEDQVLSANLAFAALVGRERRAVVGRPLAEVLPMALPGPADGLVETSFTAPGGEERYLQVSQSDLGGQAPRQRILMVQDVTERVAIENELKEKDRLASLGMLAAGVAHEVNTPITGISSYAQMLLEETPEEDPRHLLLRKMERQTFRAARIVSSLLDFARHRRSDHRPLELATLVEEALGEVRDRLAEGGIELSWQPPCEELIVAGSETELVQVFANLLSNAVDAMDGGGRLTVSVEARGERVVAAVEDTGVGIAAEQLDKIFQPFFSTKLAAGGTGLGLSISYEIVRRHGGEIHVISQAGTGSRFIVELPRHGASAEVGA